MITAHAFAGKRYAVLGLARSGAATVEALLASGAQVLAWDEREEARAPFAKRVELADPLEADLTGFDGIVVSPGVPLNTHPIAAHAARFGVPVIGDIELFAQARSELPPHKVVGITGTNGKSTTTALVHHILRTAGVATTMGGNIGLPILAQEPLPKGGVYVLELSSFQIDLTFSLDCDVAVLLNVTPDHLDRYENFEAYAASKERLLELQSSDHAVVFGHSFHEQRRATYDRYFMGSDRRKCQCLPSDCLQDPADLWDAFDSSKWLSVQKDWPTLQGPHNAENAGAAIGVGYLLDLTNEQISEGLRTFPGLPHRMERVGENGGVLFVNDSKGTNTAATAPALAAFDKIHWIVGGQAKELGLGECEAELGHVKAAYTIGEAGPAFADLLEGRVPVTRSETLDRAVGHASRCSEPGDTVLLSPACASFDQFRDYEERGEVFRSLVAAVASEGHPA